MNFIFSKNIDKKTVFAKVQEIISSNIRIKSFEMERPWGGFFVIEEEDTAKFIHQFFQDISLDELQIAGKLSPKILIVEPGKKLSWQYHHRRSEIWKAIGGNIKVVTSHTDEEKETTTLMPGDIIKLSQGQRHRIVGLDDWGVVAEIWQHTDCDNPSTEEDIVRVQDDFGR